MEYTLDLLVFYQPTGDSINSQYKLKVHLPVDVFKRWCKNNLSYSDSMLAVEHWRFEETKLVIDVESYNYLGYRGKDVKRAFIKWLLNELRKEYHKSVVSIEYP